MIDQVIEGLTLEYVAMSVRIARPPQLISAPCDVVSA